MRCEATDMAIVTETWLTNSEMESIWMESNGFVKDYYQISTINRTGRKGGRIALIHRSNINVIKVDQKQNRSFESAHWMMTTGNHTLNILGLYHPPYSVRQKITNTMFIDDLTDYLTDSLASFRNILICGEFNIYIDDPNDTEVQIFNDMMEAPGLQHHISFETHCAGNTMDVLFTEITLQLNTRTFKGRSISDHRAIVSELDIRVQHNNSRMVTFRNLTQINVEEYQSSLNFGNTEEMEDLDLVYEKYENELTRVLDQLAPDRTKLLTNRDNRPWFNQALASQKRVLRRCKKIWLRYRTEACWQAYQHARRHYQGKIVEKKKEMISKKIEECGSDSRKLFQLVIHLTGCKPRKSIATQKHRQETCRMMNKPTITRRTCHERLAIEQK